MIVQENGYSFPSSHAFVAVAFYGLLIYFIYKSKISKKKKIILIPLITLIIFSIGISRIYLGVHFPTDVLGGFILGIVYLIAFIEIFIRLKGVVYEKEKRKK